MPTRIIRALLREVLSLEHDHKGYPEIVSSVVDKRPSLTDFRPCLRLARATTGWGSFEGLVTSRYPRNRRIKKTKRLLISTQRLDLVLSGPEW